jgi:circadian clock protein KaiC
MAQNTDPVPLSAVHDLYSHSRNSIPVTHDPNKRASTGVSGLDDVLRGGLPRNRFFLVEGDPGAGKTTLAMQYLLQGAEQGEKGLYITLSETKEELEEIAESHGWQLDKISIFELSAIEHELSGEEQTTLFYPSEVELGRTTQVLLDEVKRVQPVRLVFDSLSEMRLLAQQPLRYRKQMLALKQFFIGKGTTVLLLDDRTANGADREIQSLVHGVISLEQWDPLYGMARRRISVRKMRGVQYRGGWHDYIIQRGGMQIYPRLIAAEHHTNFIREPISSGVENMDRTLGGGLDRGTSTLLMGPPGTGKSSVALQFVMQAAERGERVMINSFDENLHTIVARSRSLGMLIDKQLENGMLELRQIDPAELTPGEFSHYIKNAVEKEQVKVVVLDSLNGYLNAMPEERFLNLQLHELLTYLNQQGVVSILVLAQQGLLGHMTSPVDLTYLADTVVTLRYFESQGAVKQAISVIKKRSGNHERMIREFNISGNGISVGEPLTDFQGILTGVPTFSGALSLLRSAARDGADHKDNHFAHTTAPEQ